MASIRPFRGLRFNPEQFADLGQVVAPLADTLTAEQQAYLYAHPFNALHLTKPLPEEEDETERDTLRIARWRAQGVFHQDALPSYYPYFQEFSLYGYPGRFVRKGFVALVRIWPRPYTRTIKRHEQILTRGLNGALQQIRRLELNVTPTHGLYFDPQHTLEPLLDPYLENPWSQVNDHQGVCNKLGLIQQRPVLERITQFLAPRPIYLADGHHRLAASIALAEAVANKLGGPPPWQLQHHLMFLSNGAGDDLQIWPTHRVVELPEGYTGEQLRAGLSEYFRLAPADQRTPLHQELHKHPRNMALALPDGVWLLHPRADRDLPGRMPASDPKGLRQLPAYWLHRLVFEHLLGFPHEQQARNPRLRYLKDQTRALDEGQRPGCAAFLLNSIGMGDLMAVADHNALLPPKSTYFYPKVLSGLVLHSLRDVDHNSALDLSF